MKRKKREIQKDNNSLTNIPSDEFDINSDSVNNNSKNFPSITN